MSRGLKCNRRKFLRLKLQRMNLPMSKGWETKKKTMEKIFNVQNQSFFPNRALIILIRKATGINFVIIQTKTTDQGFRNNKN